jgi:hypothetical protein
MWDTDEALFHQRCLLFFQVRQPLLLISEIQRSGGTLLCQLLDGHPQLHVHPSELHIGRPNKYFWPNLNLAQPADALFEQLWETPALTHARDGYSKGGIVDNRPLPFSFSASIQRRLFAYALELFGSNSQRDVLDAYLTSYFNAWLDYKYLDKRDPRYWVTFVPRLLFDPENRKRIFTDYPDGRIVSIIRHPVSWYASAVRYAPKFYKDLDTAIDLWKTSVTSALETKSAWAEKVLLLSFEDLVADHVRVVREVCGFAGIEMPPAPLLPTFNGWPIEANSSFGDLKGIDKSSINREDALSLKARKQIWDACGGLFEEAQKILAFDKSQKLSASERPKSGGWRFPKLWRTVRG